ncbi:MAG: prepilin-type N-terminal cleavage/methylation domain-containing protein [Thiohalomonadaceae bacterium]
MKTTISPRQKGITLVELMVAMVISLILLAGVSQIFISNRETYRIQNNLARLQENARFAIDLLRSDLSMAGFPDGFDPFDVANTNDTSLAARLQGPDCEGNLGAGTIVKTYTVTDTSLTCNGIPLVDGIQAMTFVYGEDTDDDREAERYVLAPGANRIVSVRLTLTAIDPDLGFTRTFVTTIPLRNVQ